MEGDISFGRWISLLYRYGQIYMNRELEPYNTGRGQFLFLLVLYRRDGLPQEELAQILNIDKGTTARALNKLEQAGYIRRESDAKNLRTNRIYLTEQADNFRPRLRAIINRWTETLSAGMTAEEVEQTAALLARMAHNAVEYIRKERNCGRQEQKTPGKVKPFETAK